MLESLKPFVNMGLSVIWLKENSKVPIEKRWTNLKTKTWPELRDQYKPGFNCGVRPGKPSKLKDGFYLCVIDCDMKSTEDAHKIEMEKALSVAFPDWEFSPTVISGRNEYSLHIYAKVHEPLNRFQIAESAHRVRTLMPSRAPSIQDRAEFLPSELEAGWRLARAWEITFLGSGSQAVMPPSIHPDSGREYTWKNRLESVDDLIEYSPRKFKKVSQATTNLAFKFVEWDLMTLTDAGLSPKMIGLITIGDGLDEYGGDRSSALFAAINALVGADLSVDQIVSILTDSENAISEKALEKWGGNRERAAQWLINQVQKVKVEFSAANEFGDDEMIDEPELSEAEAQAQVEGLITWRDRLDKTQQGVNKNSSKNRALILENALKPKTFLFNEFFGGVFYGAEPPWVLPGQTATGKEISNVDLTRAKIWLQTHFKIDPSEDEIIKTVTFLAHKNAYHPVKDYLMSLTWDGKPRLSRWLFDYLDAVGPDKYVEAVGRKTLVAAVARVVKPGCKFDCVLVLEGGQGVGKSSAISILSDPWTSATHIDPNNKDTINNIQNCWIIELPEMTPAHRADAESLKAFLSKTEDRARLAYERKAETFPRQCIFIGTTNQSEYLQDETGNRRFWPVVVGALDREKLKADKDQLWAEAFAYYLGGEDLYLEEKDVEMMAIEQQRERYQADEWLDEVREFVAKRPQNFKALDVFNFIRGLEGDTSAGGFSRGDQMRIAKCLRFLGYANVRSRNEGERVRFWAKIGKN